MEVIEFTEDQAQKAAWMQARRNRYEVPPSIRRRMWVCIALFWVACAVVVVANADLLSALVAIVCGLALTSVAVIGPEPGPRVRRFLHRFQSDVKVTISDEGLTRTTARGSRYYPWTKVRAQQLKDDYVVVSLDNHEFVKLHVPRGAFPSERDWREFNSYVMTGRPH